MSSTSTASDAPTPTLSIFDATMITVGIVIGAGIFETPVLVAGIAGSPMPMLIAWVLGGVLSFIGALTYAELATTYPSAGGDYTFLTRAYGKSVSFLFAWARSTVICTGSIALLGFILGDYLSRLLPLGEHSSAIYAAGAVLLLTAINLVGLKGSSRMQNAFAIVEIGGVIAVAVAALMLGGDASAPAIAETAPATSSSAFGLAMVFVLLTYGGWNEAAYVSAEVRGGPRAVLRTLLLSIAIITAVYLLFVCGVLYGLGFETLKSSHAVGVDVAERAVGPVGAQIVGLLVAVSSLTSMNSTMIAGARSNYSVAHDWSALRFMGQWQGRRSTPAMGFIVQAGIALALIGFGALEQGRLCGHGRVHRAGVLAVLHAERRGAVHSAQPRPGCAAAVPRAAVPGAADRVRAELRLRALFEHRARADGTRYVRRVCGDAERRDRAAATSAAAVTANRSRAACGRRAPA